MNRKLSAKERLANVVRGWIKSMVAAFVAGAAQVMENIGKSHA